MGGKLKTKTTSQIIGGKLTTKMTSEIIGGVLAPVEAGEEASEEVEAGGETGAGESETK